MPRSVSGGGGVCGGEGGVDVGRHKGGGWGGGAVIEGRASGCLWFLHAAALFSILSKLLRFGLL